jgi:hypothetical protein
LTDQELQQEITVTENKLRELKAQQQDRELRSQSITVIDLINVLAKLPNNTPIVYRNPEKRQLEPIRRLVDIHFYYSPAERRLYYWGLGDVNSDEINLSQLVERRGTDFQ